MIAFIFLDENYYSVSIAWNDESGRFQLTKKKKKRKKLSKSEAVTMSGFVTMNGITKGFPFKQLLRKLYE